MERSTFRDSRVIEAFSKYKRIRFDMSESSQVQKEWLQAMHLYGPPALIFIDNKVVFKKLCHFLKLLKTGMMHYGNYI